LAENVNGPARLLLQGPITIIAGIPPLI
jgi:hypothetical protein